MPAIRTVQPFLIAALAVLLAACTDRIPTRVDFHIDNPTSTPLRISIDGTPYEIAPGTQQAVTLSTGVHRLQAPLTGDIEFMVYGQRGTQGVLMNPTFSPYVLMREIYVVDDAAAKGFGAFNRTLSLDGVEYTGNFELREGLFMSRTWRFDLDEEFPDELVVYDARKGSIPDKLFRKLDFVRYFEANYDEEGRYDAEHTPPVEPVAEYPDMHTLHVFSHAGVEAAAQPLRQLCNELLATTDPAEAARLQARYFDLQMAFTSATATLASELDQRDRPAYNAFVMSVSSLMSMEARVLPPRP